MFYNSSLLTQSSLCCCLVSAVYGAHRRVHEELEPCSTAVKILQDVFGELPKNTEWRWHLQHREKTVRHDTFYFARLALVLMYWARGQGKPLLNFAKKKEEGWKESLGDLSALERNFIQLQWKRVIVMRKNNFISKCADQEWFYLSYDKKNLFIDLDRPELFLWIKEI